MDKNLIIILQKYSVEVLVLAFAVLVAVYLTKKALKGKFSKVCFYLPYLYGILAYLVYCAVFSKEYSQAVNMGITTGAVSMIYKALFTSSDNKNFTKNFLSGFIEEDDIKRVCEQVNSLASKGDEENLAKVLKKHCVVPLEDEQISDMTAILIKHSEKTDL